MNEYMKIIKQQEFRKQTEEAKFEAFASMCGKVAELEAKIEKMKSQYDYAFNQLCKSREILCSMLSQYRDRKEIDYSTRECGEKLLKEGVCKND